MTRMMGWKDGEGWFLDGTGDLNQSLTGFLLSEMKDDLTV